MDSTQTISHASTILATSVLRKFQDILISHHVPSAHSRLVATLAIHESTNRSQFIHSIHKTLGLDVDALSVSEEARLIYLGILHFHPIHNNMILTIDIGGRSTEFVIGYQELKRLVKRLNNEERKKGAKKRRRKFFSRQSAFIVGGAVLLEEIFNSLELKDMKVSKYVLGEGVIVEMAKQV
ncbi:hypothetical protein LIER_11556 [Lithospermum erythrorhizon]|uniref:Ppx/GppA phosphatase N-terminal domain-containing protein n=1 Tax=Lithospermum erythrorhizon TaxID=34254 RepID=A0AAV3PRC7_LITER